MSKFIKTVIATSIAMFLGATAQAKTITVDPARAVYLQGVVDYNVVFTAQQVEQLARTSTAPVWIIINSPGGGVYPGLQLVSAMRRAQARGVTIKCVTTLMAASMAFQVFANCNERYAFEYSMLMFHPMRSYSRSGQTSDELIQTGRDLDKLEQPEIRWLLHTLKIPRKEFDAAYRAERMWTGQWLKAAAPHFLTLVDDVKGIEAFYSLEGY
jgi:ATP-dependent protease ClpP protease subunit